MKLWPSWLAIVLLAMAAFMLNVTYSMAVPPWMGPDEPRHVEYVLTLAEHGRPVAPGDSLPAVEEQIIRSMDRYNFWRHGLVSSQVYQPGTMPTRFDQIWAPGVSHELHQPPLYYLLQVPIVVLSRNLDVAVQVRLMRLLSLHVQRRLRLPRWRVAGAVGITMGALLWLVGPLADALNRAFARMPLALRSFVDLYVFFRQRPSPVQDVAASLQQLTPADVLTYSWRWMRMLFSTFWALFGGVNVPLHRLQSG